MKVHFKKIAVVCRRNNQSSISTLLSLVNYLKKKRVKVFLEEATAAFITKKKMNTVAVSQLGKTCDLVAAIGGDGSFLSAARMAAKQSLPVIGINRGQLGFLTDIMPQDTHKISDILRGIFHEERRLLLRVRIIDNGKQVLNDLAVNDVVFLSRTTGHLIEFSVRLDDKFLCKYRADGLIVATPTGSTAHALSGGGPILYPTLENIVLVPMFSHNLSSRPIVVDGNSNIEIIFTKPNKAELLVICDGHTKTQLRSGSVQISKAKEKLRLLHPTDYDYFDILRTKLNWERECGKSSKIC